MERGAQLCQRRVVEYWCIRDHRTAMTLAADAEPPERWDCGSCGAPAVVERGAAPSSAREAVFFRTPYEFLMMRRTPEDGEALLAEALDKLASTRASRKAR